MQGPDRKPFSVFRPHGNSPSARHFTNKPLLFNFCISVIPPKQRYVNGFFEIFQPLNSKRNIGFSSFGERKQYIFIATPHFINKQAPATTISADSINTSAPVGKTRQSRTPAPNASAPMPAVFAKRQRINTTAFRYYSIHKTQALLI